MGRTKNPNIIRRKSNEKRTYNKPAKIVELKAKEGKAEKPEKLTKKSKFVEGSINPKTKG